MRADGLSRLVLFSFLRVGKTEGISIKYIKPIPKGEECKQRCEISNERVFSVRCSAYDSLPATALCKFGR